MSEPAAIRPEILAAKMDAIRNFKAPKVAAQAKLQPRLLELLWAILSMSRQPGGLAKFCADFVAEFPHCLGTKTMHRLAKKHCGPSDIEAIMEEIPRHYHQYHAQTADWLETHFWNKARPCAFSEHRPDQKFLDGLNYQCFVNLCRDYALTHLPGHLARVCHEAETPLEDPWYCQGLLDALIQMLDTHAKRASASLAQTEVTLKIKDALAYALEEKALCFILGDPRIGKTATVKIHCAAWPGKFVLVATPPSNTLADLHKAFADALGIEYTYRTPAREIQAKVEYVIRHCGLVFILDESQWNFPANFTANTPPQRLNWLRSRLVDQGCPVVLIATPQEFERCKNKYAKATSHRIEQFMGRKMLDIILPNELEADDLLAVARVHFPELENDFLQVIVGTAMRSESYLMAVEALAKRVRYIARRDGHKTVTLADLKLAISEIMPAPPASTKPATPEKVLTPAPLAIPVKRSRPLRPAANRITAAAPLEAPERANSPAFAAS